MKLWLLEPVENLNKNDNPWARWHDKAFGFVVRAETEVNARKIAASEAGDENNWVRKRKINPWIHVEYSTCIELLPDGPEEMILCDFHSA
jgi:hypothetical protein